MTWEGAYYRDDRGRLRDWDTKKLLSKETIAQLKKKKNPRESSEVKILIAELKPHAFAKKVKGVIIKEYSHGYDIQVPGLGQWIHVMHEDIKKKRIVSAPRSNPGKLKSFINEPISEREKEEISKIKSESLYAKHPELEKEFIYYHGRWIPKIRNPQEDVEKIAKEFREAEKERIEKQAEEIEKEREKERKNKKGLFMFENPKTFDTLGRYSGHFPPTKKELKDLKKYSDHLNKLKKNPRVFPIKIGDRPYLFAVYTLHDATPMAYTHTIDQAAAVAKDLADTFNMAMDVRQR